MLTGFFSSIRQVASIPSETSLTVVCRESAARPVEYFSIFALSTSSASRFDSVSALSLITRLCTENLTRQNLEFFGRYTLPCPRLPRDFFSILSIGIASNLFTCVFGNVQACFFRSGAKSLVLFFRQAESENYLPPICRCFLWPAPFLHGFIVLR